MKQHVSILGVLYIVMGGIGILSAIVVLVLFGGLAGVAAIAGEGEEGAEIAAPVFGGMGVGLSVGIAIISLPSIIVGIGLVKMRSWARVLGIILSALNLLNFPLGTLLGGYGLWVLLNKEIEGVLA